jgi:replicative DNA helicase
MENKTLVEYWSEAVERYEERRKRGKPEFETGLKWVDEATDGLRRGDIWVVAGKSGSGKTTLALQMARNFADNKDHSILFLSLEMRGWELVTRMFCEMQGADFAQLRKGYFPKNFKEREKTFREYIKNIDFEIFEYGYKFSEVEKIIETAYKTKKPDVIFLDFLQLIEWKTYREEHIALMEYTRKIKELANKMQIAFVIISQLRRLPSGVNYERPPDIIDLKGSGAIENAADKILLIYTIEADEQREHYINLAKNRQGETKTEQVFFDGAKYRFRDMDKVRTEYSEIFGL